MGIKYKQRKDGEGWSQKSGEIFRLGCCDCGLVHDMILISEKPGLIGIAARINPRATFQKRRKKPKYLTLTKKL